MIQFDCLMCNLQEQLAAVRQELAALEARIRSLECDPDLAASHEKQQELRRLRKKERPLRSKESLWRGLTPFGFDHALQVAPFNSQKLRPAQQTRQVRKPEKYSPTAADGKRKSRRPQHVKRARMVGCYSGRAQGCITLHGT